MADATVLETNLAGVKKINQGKVRDIYEVEDKLLIVATDRISAYDVVLPTAIPGKGVMLTSISKFWFEFFGGDVPHHLIEVVSHLDLGHGPIVAGTTSSLIGQLPLPLPDDSRCR